jgi:aminomethyltransferase
MHAPALFMTDTSVAELRKTPLHARHRASNARMVPFAGWDMPVEYSGIAAEHVAVRTRAGLFDVSHMGQIEIAGKNALAAVQRISCNDAAALEVGQAQYSGLLTPEGTFVDDLLVYRMASSHFMLVANASNVKKDFAWISEQIKQVGDAAAVDTSSRYALIALQGPASQDVLQPLTGVDLGELRYYWFGHGEVAGARVTISRTGYTGEDGFEIFVPPAMADRVWQGILESGRSADVIPCGLGARDTLRLEAAMRLWGNDIDESTTVMEAGMDWIVGWEKSEFIGRSRLHEQKGSGLTRRLVGFEMVDRGIARHGYSVVAGDRPVGVVTSGTQTPFLKKAIGMAYVPIDSALPGSDITIDVRGRPAQARVVSIPFYRRPRR